jgi:hypothetical protein
MSNLRRQDRQTAQGSAIHLAVSSPSRTTDFPELNRCIIANALIDVLIGPEKSASVM